ncbi:SDR family NAD(P)-dependent oxidoreductase [Rubinisphaera sp.]|uniref:SDR family NAD(P)-dependent oxidoreductase n=1 Tax=Rubinisphaera sp. TaxID=2024857 RepID=UPI000C0F9730|nr:SDR family NAD(P)-dependent oxidoreductase [Rubinisphaera sp.]MBV07920.1 short-chain dehydrogenase [Rubinisphaera sp.]HCS53386.1 NAD(P)-dependent oxidoreductase [Planctomycetaceae bacterium]|tara:strand:- start:6025 stop:6909 length:885 start_codon:yes stop_codon:yes gene_type:complete
MWKIHRKRVVVTGAASGIGRELSLQLAAKNVHLCLVDLQGEKLEETAQLCRTHHVEVQTLCADLCDEQTPARVAQLVREELGGLDLLFNNAGISYYGQTDKMTSEQLHRVVGVNFVAPLNLTHALIPLLLEQRRSHIVNIASMFGLFPTQRSTAYHATKYGLIGYSHALRAEYLRYGLGVTAVCPGFVRTELFDSMLQPEGEEKRAPPRWITTTPEIVARKAIRAAERNQRLVPITLAAYVGYHLQRFFPAALDLGYRLERRKAHPLRVAAELKTPVPVTVESLLDAGLSADRK